MTADDSASDPCQTLNKDGQGDRSWQRCLANYIEALFLSIQSTSADNTFDMDLTQIKGTFDTNQSRISQSDSPFVTPLINVQGILSLIKIMAACHNQRYANNLADSL